MKSSYITIGLHDKARNQWCGKPLVQLQLMLPRWAETLPKSIPFLSKHLCKEDGTIISVVLLGLNEACRAKAHLTKAAQERDRPRPGGAAGGAGPSTPPGWAGSWPCSGPPRAAASATCAVVRSSSHVATLSLLSAVDE